MFSMGKPCSKLVSTLNSVLSTWFAYDSSIRSCIFSVCTLRQLRPIAVKKHKSTIVGGKFRENTRVSLKKPVYNVLLH